MMLTREEETKLLNDYDKIVWKMVNRFCGSNKSSIFTKDDLYQECMIVLIRHMQNCKTYEELRRIQTMELVNVMTRYVLSSQAAHLDVNRTSEVKKILQGMAGSVSYDSLVIASSGEDAVEIMDYENFVSTLTPLQKRIVRLKEDGYTNRQVSRMLGVSDQSVSEALKRARTRYDQYMAVAA